MILCLSFERGIVAMCYPETLPVLSHFSIAIVRLEKPRANGNKSKPMAPIFDESDPRDLDPAHPAQELDL
jgi:hypothetical protein